MHQKSKMFGQGHQRSLLQGHPRDDYYLIGCEEGLKQNAMETLQENVRVNIGN